MPTHRPKLDLDISGDYGNLFVLIAICKRLLIQHGYSAGQVERFSGEVRGARSYTAALGVIALWIDFNDGIFRGMT